MISVLYSLTKASKYLLFKAPFRMTDEHRFIQRDTKKQKSKKRKNEEKLIKFPKPIRIGTLSCLIAFFLGMILMSMAIYHLCYSLGSAPYSTAYSLFGINM